MVRIRIFSAKRKHIAELIEINKNNMPENYSEDYWINVISRHLSWIAQINNKIVGYIIIDKMLQNDLPQDNLLQKTLDKYLLVSIAVSKEYRQLGCAKKLITEALSELRKNNTSINSIIYLHVRASNISAHNLYYKFGFVEAIKLKKYYIDPIEDALEMTKVLT